MARAGLVTVALAASLLGVSMVAWAETDAPARCTAETSAPASLWTEIRHGRVGFDNAGGFASTASPRQDLLFPAAVAARGDDVFIYDAGQRALLHYSLANEALGLFAVVNAAQPEVRLYLSDNYDLYLVDPSGAEVTRFARDGSVVARYDNRSELAQPVAATSDSHGRLLIADGLARHILAFDELGGIADTLATESDGGPDFGAITAMARAGERLYVVDGLRHELRRSDDGGRRWSSFGGDALVQPGAIAADSHGRVFVAEQSDATIKVFTDGVQSAVIDSHSVAGLTPFARIFDLSIDEPYLYVADGPNGRIVVLQLEPPCAAP